jgi:hypothetical protein
MAFVGLKHFSIRDIIEIVKMVAIIIMYDLDENQIILLEWFKFTFFWFMIIVAIKTVLGIFLFVISLGDEAVV